MNLSELVKKCDELLTKPVSVNSQKFEISGMELNLNGLNAEEWNSVFTAPIPREHQVNRAIYCACPELREAAEELVRQEKIADYPDIADMFTEREKQILIERITALSGQGVRLKFSPEVYAVKKL